MFSESDTRHMARALALARQGLYTTTPNPRVGAVLVRHGDVVGEGWHRAAGQAHAEVLAIAQAGERARGATAYVSLEPCSHHGRTGPCADALLRAGVSRVIAAMEDPNPLVTGRGLARLREAGVSVSCGLLEEEARELNLGFVSRMTRGRPWLRLKAAASLDGRTALPSGQSQWITGEAARADGHAWRARACAVLTGIGTVREDNPKLDVRAVSTARQPLRIVVDSRLEIDPAARVLAGGSALVVCAVDDAVRRAALIERGCDVLVLPHVSGKVDLMALMRALGERGLNEVHAEAGFKLNGSLIRERCADELLLYMAPCLLGDGAGVANIAPLTDLADRPTLRLHALDRVGDDIRIVARFKGGA